MSLLGVVLQAGVSGVLSLVPAAILKKERMRVTIVSSFLAIFATCKVGGLIFAAPITAFLLLFALWVRFVGHAHAGVKRVLFGVTLVLSALILALQVVHLPIRIALHQPAVMIAANVAAILVAATMLSATLAMLIVKKRTAPEIPN
jgi:hypothetical protein